MTCRKTFIQAVQSSLVAYYKFDTNASNIFVDSIGSSNLDHNDGTSQPNLVSGFINNGIQIPFSLSDTDPYCLNWLPSLTSQSQTYRFWVKVTNSGNANATVYVVSPYVEIDAEFVTGNLFRVAIYLTSSPGGGQPVQTFHVDTSGVDQTKWHSVAVTIDYAGQMCAVYLDNVKILSQVITLTPPYLVPNNNPTAKSLFVNLASYTSGSVAMIDELGVWGQARTTDQLTADWNGGAGTTYP